MSEASPELCDIGTSGRNYRIFWSRYPRDWKGKVSLQVLGGGQRLVKVITHPVVLSPFCDRVLSIISRMQHLPFS